MDSFSSTNFISLNQKKRSADVPYEKSKGLADRAHGDDFHVYKLMLFFLTVCSRFVNDRIQFQLACEYDLGGKFDDIYFKYLVNDKPVYLWMQLKHCDKDNVPMYLLTKDKKNSFFKETTCYLQELCYSYVRMRVIPKGENMFILFSNKILNTNEKFGDGFTLKDEDFCEVYYPLEEVFDGPIKRFSEKFLKSKKGEALIKYIKPARTDTSLQKVEEFLLNFCLALGQPNAKALKTKIEKVLRSQHGAKCYKMYDALRCKIEDWLKNKAGIYITNSNLIFFKLSMELHYKFPILVTCWNEMNSNFGLLQSVFIELYSQLSRPRDEVILQVNMFENYRSHFLLYIIYNHAYDFEHADKSLNNYRPQYENYLETFDIVFYINGENEDTFLNSLVQLGEQINLIDKNLDKNEKIILVKSNIYKIGELLKNYNIFIVIFNYHFTKYTYLYKYEFLDHFDTINNHFGYSSINKVDHHLNRSNKLISNCHNFKFVLPYILNLPNKDSVLLAEIEPHLSKFQMHEVYNTSVIATDIIVSEYEKSNNFNHTRQNPPQVYTLGFTSCQVVGASSSGEQVNLAIDLKKDAPSEKKRLRQNDWKL